MLQVQITKDKAKLQNQIKTLELILEENNLTAGDREVFTETLKILEDAKQEGKEMKPIFTNYTIKRLSPEEVKENENYFGKYYTRLLQKADLTQNEIYLLGIFKRMYMGHYSPHLIAKCFLNYRKNIEKILALEIELEALGIILPIPSHRLQINGLNRMVEEMDGSIYEFGQEFYPIWKEMKDDYCFGKILFRFRQNKKLGQVVTA